VIAWIIAGRGSRRNSARDVIDWRLDEIVAKSNETPSILRGQMIYDLMTLIIHGQPCRCP
jgi:hypothetical protein